MCCCHSGKSHIIDILILLALCCSDQGNSRAGCCVFCKLCIFISLTRCWSDQSKSHRGCCVSVKYASSYHSWSHPGKVNCGSSYHSLHVLTKVKVIGCAMFCKVCILISLTRCCSDPNKGHRRYCISLNCASSYHSIHAILTQVEVMEGELVCPETGRKFPIQNGIPNMLLNEDEVS